MNDKFNFTIQAYIPKSLGKPLLSYFEPNILFNPRILKNYDEFRNKLQNLDSHGGTWIAEPGTNFILNKFFMTDDIDFHSRSHASHNYRLSIKGTVDMNKIGTYRYQDKDKVFLETNGRQSSGESHRCTAYILNTSNPSPYGYSGFGEYYGYCSDINSQRSEQLPLGFRVSNNRGFPYHLPFPAIKADFTAETIMEISATAGYPFLEPFSPNIDISLKITMKKPIYGRNVTIIFEGQHNFFPAYELLLNNQVIYSYDPVQHGFSGPSPFNLSVSKKFIKPVFIPFIPDEEKSLKVISN